MHTSGPYFDHDLGESERRRWLSALAGWRLFQDASAETTERVVASATFRKVPPDALMSREGEPASSIFFLLDGIARVFQRHAELEYSPKIFQAPVHFGDLAGLAGAPTYKSSVQALTEVVVAEVPYAVLEARLEADHALALAWLRSVARQHAMTIDHDRESVFGGLEGRVTNVLLTYADLFGVPEPRGVGIDHGLSYGKLAMHVGSSRRAIIRVVQRLAGWVTPSAEGWRIDRAGLEAQRTTQGRVIRFSLTDRD